MSEKVPYDNNRKAGNFICHAMEFLNQKDSLEVTKDMFHPVVFDIEFKVNGVNVPFVETINYIYEQMKISAKQELAEQWYDIAKLESLRKLQEMTENFEYEIKQYLKSIFGVDINTD